MMRWKGGTWATEENGLGFGDGNPDHVMLGSGLGTVWLGGRVVRTLDLRSISRSRVRILASPLSSATLGKLLTHMCLCHRAV